MNYTKRKLVSVTRRIMNYYYLVHAPPIRWTCFRLIGGGRDNCRMRRNSIYSPCNRWIRSKKVRTLPDIYYRVPPYRAIWSNFSVAGCVFIFMKRFRERIFGHVQNTTMPHTVSFKYGNASTRLYTYLSSQTRIKTSFALIKVCNRWHVLSWMN